MAKTKCVCRVCGGSNVQLVCWVYPNTHEVVSFYSENWDAGNGVTFCDDCGEDTGITEVPKDPA